MSTINEEPRKGNPCDNDTPPDSGPAHLKMLWAALREVCERYRGRLKWADWCRLRDDLFTEAEHARRIAGTLRGRYVYAAPDVGWLAYDGICWRRAEPATLLTAAEAAGAELLDLRDAAAEVMRMFGGKEKQEIAPTFAKLARAYERSQTRTPLKHALELAAGEPAARVDAALLDRHPHLLATPGGTINLRTGYPRENDPADYLTRAAAVAPLRGAPARWLATLREAFGHYPDPGAMVEHARRWFGYCLTGETSEELFVWFWNRQGRGGKGTITEPYSKALGDYADRAPKGRFNPARTGEHPTVNMERRGRCFTFESEPSKKRPLDTEQIKTYTGNDTERGRLMRCDYAAGFDPTDKLLFQANHPPNPDNPECEAFWERILPWQSGVTYRRPDTPDRPDNSRELKADTKAAILNDPTELGRLLGWCIGGAVKWYRDGLAIPAAVYNERKALRNEVDPLGQFIRERTAADRGSIIGATVLLEAYNGWAAAREADPTTAKALAQELKARGWKSIHKMGGNFWTGRMLLDEPISDAEEHEGSEAYEGFPRDSSYRGADSAPSVGASYRTNAHENPSDPSYPSFPGGNPIPPGADEEATIATRAALAKLPPFGAPEREPRL